MSIFNFEKPFRVMFLVPSAIHAVLSKCICILCCLAQVLELVPSVCNLGSTSDFVLPFTWYVASSANRSISQYSIWRGRSLIKIKNNVGPKIDPWGTPVFISAGFDNPWPMSITCWRLCRYELNKFKSEPLHLYSESLSIRMEWSTRSNAFRKSRKTEPTKSPLSMHAIHWSINLTKAVWQLCLSGLTLWKLWMNHILSMLNRF